MAEAEVVQTVKKPEVLAEPKHFFLSKEERLEFQNIDLRKHLLDMQVQRESSRLQTAQTELVSQVNKRISIDLRDYRVNIETGELTETPPNERPPRLDVPPVVQEEASPA
jgi:hypothetical protein